MMCPAQDKAKKNKAHISVVEEEKIVFGLYADSEMLTKLKALALNHGEPGVNHMLIQPFWDQALRMREVMAPNGTECPWRKRKLRQFVKDKSKSANGLSSNLCKQQRVAKFRRGQISEGSSASCVLNMNDVAENLNEPKLLKSSSSGSLLTREDNFKRLPPAILDTPKGRKKKTCFLIDSARSVHGSNPVAPEDMIIQEPQSINLDDSSESSNMEESIYVNPPRRPTRSMKFVSGQFEKMAIPFGPHFQADVPEWSGPSKNDDSDSSRWLGTKVWPIEGQNVKITSRAVGKGRPSSCSCVSPGSTNCIKHHILEKRRFLQSDLGPVFYIWKFDEMGEEVSKSWTPDEQESFELLVEKNLQSSKSNFLKNAVNCFPSKCRKDISSYYFNVFIPRLMSLQTRSLLNDVDSDVEDVKDVYTLNIRRRCKGRNTPRGTRKDVKSSYSRHS